MDEVSQIRKKLNLPPISQLGIVVRDMTKAVDYYSSCFGLGPFTVYESVPNKYWFNGEPSYMKIRQGKAMLGNIEIELIQPLEGKSPFHEFLESQGEGLQHLAFNAPSFEEMYHLFVEAGFKPLMEAEAYVETYQGTVRACHFDTRQIGGVIFEIVWKSWLMK